MKLRSIVAMPTEYLIIFLLALSVLLGGLQFLLPLVLPRQPISLAPLVETTPAQSRHDQDEVEPVIRTHHVTQGETLSEIAAKYKIDVDTLVGANPQLSDTIFPGDELTVLPQKGVLHTVELGDSYWQIANMYGVEVDVIKRANAKQYDHLDIGEKLFVPGGRARPAYIASRGSIVRFIWPARGELSSPYGWRWGRLHAGVDIANDEGTPVRAAYSGRVNFSGWRGGYGLTVMIDHGRNYTTLYGHLSESIVAPGQYVQTGQVIAYMGNTGYSTGPHLHFEVETEGRTLNPLAVLP